MVGGPGTLRFIIQPTIALMLGIMHGIHDRHLGRPPYLADLGRARGHRLQRLGEGVRAIAVPLAIALGASLTFQFIIRKRVHIVTALLYALLFVAVPYFLARGAANRLAHEGSDRASVS
jgi:hypothetical protein